MGQGGGPSGNSLRSRVRRPRRPRGSHPVHGSGHGARARGWGGRVGWVAGEHDPVNAPSLAQPRRTGTERAPACCSPHRSHPLPSSRPFRWTTRPRRGPRGVRREHGPLFPLPSAGVRGAGSRGGGGRAGRGARTLAGTVPVEPCPPTGTAAHRGRHGAGAGPPEPAPAHRHAPGSRAPARGVPSARWPQGVPPNPRGRPSEPGGASALLSPGTPLKVPRPWKRHAFRPRSAAGPSLAPRRPPTLGRARTVHRTPHDTATVALGCGAVAQSQGTVAVAERVPQRAHPGSHRPGQQVHR